MSVKTRAHVIVDESILREIDRLAGKKKEAALLLMRRKRTAETQSAISPQ